MEKDNLPSKDYIEYICELYDDVYDDRIENCCPPMAGKARQKAGEYWMPGERAHHKSLITFQNELLELGIKLSTTKLRKILITGGRWTTKRSREIAGLFDTYTRPVTEGGKGLDSDIAIRKIAEDLKVSIVTVNVNLPYKNVVYKLEERSKNAVRCARYKERLKGRKKG